MRGLAAQWQRRAKVQKRDVEARFHNHPLKPTASMRAASGWG
jgi:hypothetical protein